jgi:hypothetical protein
VNDGTGFHKKKEKENDNDEDEDRQMLFLERAFVFVTRLVF